MVEVSAEVAVREIVNELITLRAEWQLERLLATDTIPIETRRLVAEAVQNTGVLLRSSLREIAYQVTLL